MYRYRVEIDLGFDVFGLNRLQIGLARKLQSSLSEQLGMPVARRRSRMRIEAGSEAMAQLRKREIEQALQNRLLEASLSIRSNRNGRWKTLSRDEFRPVLPYPGPGEPTTAPWIEDGRRQ